MTERKLTPEEVDSLLDFCTRHYVPEYDLQVELVDHLASGIENQWAENPDLPFQVALNNTFDQFGIFGFSKIKSQKEKELRRKYRNLFWKYTLEFFRLPKILLTILLTIVLFALYRVASNFYAITLSMLVLLILVNLWYVFLLFPRKYKIETVDNKSFVLINYLKGDQLGISILFQIPIQGMGMMKNFNYSYLNQPLITLIASFIIVCFGVLTYVYLFVLPANIRAHFIDQYPQFVKS